MSEAKKAIIHIEVMNQGESGGMGGDGGSEGYPQPHHQHHHHHHNSNAEFDAGWTME
jgi:hypothetical protein